MSAPNNNFTNLRSSNLIGTSKTFKNEDSDGGEGSAAANETKKKKKKRNKHKKKAVES